MMDANSTISAQRHLALATGTVDLATARFTDGAGGDVSLTQREVALLRVLSAAPGDDVSRGELLHEVWGHHELSLSRAVDTAITRLRRKIERDPRSPECLFTSHGVGYRLVLANTQAVSAAAGPGRRLIRLDDRVIDLDAGRVENRAGTTVLTGQERRLLELLISRPGSVVDPAQLARRAGLIGGRKALSNAIYRLRSKIEVDPATPSWLVGVRGQGYRFDAELERARPRLDGLTETLWHVAEHVGEVLGLSDCVVYAFDGSSLVQAAAYGHKAPAPGEILDPISIPVGSGIVGSAAETRTPQLVADVQRDARYIPDAQPGRSELAVPILHGERVVGVIDSESTTVAAYVERHVRVFESLARICAGAVSDLSLALAH
jgi:DNA-binding response OmpR family regulator